MTDLECRRCGRTTGVRKVRVQNPSGTVNVCEDCEDDLHAEIVEEVAV